jgi:hypothetical protein
MSVRPASQHAGCGENCDLRDPAAHEGIISPLGLLIKEAWVLKNSVFAPNRHQLGDRKCLLNARRSIVGLPDAILFLRISRVGVFQQPQAIALTHQAYSSKVKDGYAPSS